MNRKALLKHIKKMNQSLINRMSHNRLLQIFALILLCNTNIVAQYNLNRTERIVVGELDIYRAKISLLNGSVDKIEGALFQVNDSSIIISNSFDYMDYRVRKYSFNEYKISDLKRISVAKNNKLKQSTLRGGLIGAAALGGITFIMFASDPVMSESVMIASLTAGAAGFIGGAIIGVGSIHISIPINGNQEKFLSKRKKLNKRAIKNN